MSQARQLLILVVIALLAGATPVKTGELTPQMENWLRRGVIALAALALLVSLYAFAAIVYRTAIDRLTPNRLAFIGWNVINIGILAWLLVKQARAGRGRSGSTIRVARKQRHVRSHRQCSVSSVSGVCSAT